MKSAYRQNEADEETFPMTANIKGCSSFQEVLYEK
jgi:hypothetical protein